MSKLLPGVFIIVVADDWIPFFNFVLHLATEL